MKENPEKYEFCRKTDNWNIALFFTIMVQLFLGGFCWIIMNLSNDQGAKTTTFCIFLALIFISSLDLLLGLDEIKKYKYECVAKYCAVIFAIFFTIWLYGLNKILYFYPLILAFSGICDIILHILQKLFSKKR